MSSGSLVSHRGHRHRQQRSEQAIRRRQRARKAMTGTPFATRLPAFPLWAAFQGEFEVSRRSMQACYAELPEAVCDRRSKVTHFWVAMVRKLGLRHRTVAPWPLRSNDPLDRWGPHVRSDKPDLEFCLPALTARLPAMRPVRLRPDHKIYSPVTRCKRADSHFGRGCSFAFTFQVECSRDNPILHDLPQKEIGEIREEEVREFPISAARLLNSWQAKAG